MSQRIILYKTILMLSMVGLTVSELTMPDYKNHPCRRDCKSDTFPMYCQYNFTVEYYSTMSKACFQCPFNLTDCDRAHCVPADGFRKAMITVNRMFPGPEIQVCEDDLISVYVYNRMETAEGTSIHWHGIHQRQHPYMDGVSMLTQCPINAGSLFLYRFTASPAGTHYYHAHSGLQHGDGLFGAFIVRQPNDPHRDLYDIDSYDHSMIINDWTHELMIENLVARHHAGDRQSSTTNLLINGKGSFLEIKDTKDDSKKAFTPYATFLVEKGKRYRFRVIGDEIRECAVRMTIDGHPMLLIASDGKPLQPYATVNLIIYSGERYDFVLEANQTVGNYNIRYAGNGVSCGRVSQMAILHYEGAPIDTKPQGAHDYDSMVKPGKVVNPFNKPASDADIPIYKLRSLPRDKKADPALNKDTDYKFFFAIDYNLLNHDVYGDHIYTEQINHMSNHFPSSPILSQPEYLNQKLLCQEKNSRNCSKEYCSCINRYKISLGSVVEVILVDEGMTFTSQHPFHLHGYSYRVIGQVKVGDKVSVDTIKQMDKEGKLERNFDNPPIKDSVIVPDGGYTILRFYADNPGEWLFHCHLLFHAEMGMGLVFSVGEQKDLPKVPAYFPRCGDYGPSYAALARRDGVSAGSREMYNNGITVLTTILFITAAFNYYAD